MAPSHATHHQATDTTLIQRIEGLERQGRSLKLAVVGLVSTLGILLFLGLSPQRNKRFETEELILRDQAGRVRAKLSASSPDSTLMQFYDSKGTARLAVGIGLGSLPELHIFDPTGNVRMVLGTDVTGAPSIALRPPDARGGVYLSYSLDRTGDLVFVDSDNHGRAELRMQGAQPLGRGVEGATSLTLSNKDRATGISLSSGETGPIILTGIPMQPQPPDHRR